MQTKKLNIELLSLTEKQRFQFFLNSRTRQFFLTGQARKQQRTQVTQVASNIIKVNFKLRLRMRIIYFQKYNYLAIWTLQFILYLYHIIVREQYTMSRKHFSRKVENNLSMLNIVTMHVNISLKCSSNSDENVQIDWTIY